MWSLQVQAHSAVFNWHVCQSEWCVLPKLWLIKVIMGEPKIDQKMTMLSSNSETIEGMDLKLMMLHYLYHRVGRL